MYNPFYIPVAKFSNLSIMWCDIDFHTSSTLSFILPTKSSQCPCIVFIRRSNMSSLSFLGSSSASSCSCSPPEPSRRLSLSVRVCSVVVLFVVISSSILSAVLPMVSVSAVSSGVVSKMAWVTTWSWGNVVCSGTFSLSVKSTSLTSVPSSGKSWVSRLPKESVKQMKDIYLSVFAWNNIHS